MSKHYTKKLYVKSLKTYLKHQLIAVCVILLFAAIGYLSGHKWVVGPCIFALIVAGINIATDWATGRARR